jgi:hypothetical protein
MKVTVPLLGVLRLGRTPLSVAVNVTACPDFDGFKDDASAVLDDALFTVCAGPTPVEALKFVSPTYVPWIECVPTPRLDTVAVALPIALSTPVARVRVPSRNVTVPVGVPEPGEFADTVIVNVTGCPNMDGFTDVVIVMVVASWLMVCDSVALVLLPKFASPLYVAVIGCTATVQLELLKVALPLPFNNAVPKVVPPSLKVTVPVGVPLAVTVAVNVTDCPNTPALAELATVVVLACTPTDWVRVGLVLVVKFASPE